MSSDTQLLPRIKANLDAEAPASSATGARLDDAPEHAEVSEDQAPLVVPLYADLVLTLMVDRDSHFELMKHGFRELNPSLSDADMIQIGVAGLYNTIGSEIRFQGQPGKLMMAACGGNHEASLIIYEPFWTTIHEHFPGDLAVAIPTPDVLAVANADDPEAVDELRSSVARVLAGDPPSVTSNRLYRKSPGSMELSFF